MAITYNAGTNVITVTGYTEGTPCNFTDIYNADVAGGWGVVTRQCANQFCFTCKILQIGDGSTATWFADTQKMVYFNFPLPQPGNKLLIKANAHATFGTLDANSFGKDGCSFLFINEEEIKNDGEYNLYGCSLSSLPSTNYCSTWIAANTTTRFYDVMVCNLYCPIRIGGAPTVFEVNRMSIIKPDLGIRATADASYNDIYIFDPGRANVFIQNGAVLTATNCNFPQDPTYSMWVYTGGGTINLVNPAQSSYTHYWSANGNIYYKYHFDLKVIDKDNTPIDSATVKVWDKDSNLVVNTTTNASGVITQQTIIAKHYTQYTSSNKNPFLIKIEKAGYTMYEADFTLEDKTNWLIALPTSTILRNPPMTGGMV